MDDFAAPDDTPEAYIPVGRAMTSRSHRILREVIERLDNDDA